MIFLLIALNCKGEKLKLPEKCSHCNSRFNEPIHYVDGRPIEVPYFLIRTDLDFDFDDESLIEDQIFECSHCHTLFRARYELVGFVELEEKKP
jgi:hypothetical protein